MQAKVCFHAKSTRSDVRRLMIVPVILHEPEPEPSYRFSILTDRGVENCTFLTELSL